VQHLDGERWQRERPVAVVLDPWHAPQALAGDSDELSIDLDHGGH
jgi:hypothetical protein